VLADGHDQFFDVAEDASRKPVLGEIRAVPAVFNKLLRLYNNSKRAAP
jgi:hypothetical protein